MADPQVTLNEFVKNLAKHQGYENCEIKIKPISSNGANYTSVLYLVSLKNPEKEDLNLFAKVAAVGKKMRSGTSFKIYETEDLFYTKLVEIYEKLEENHNVPEEHRLVVPKYYDGTLEFMKEILILEDVTAKDFLSYDRLKVIDWEYASKCLENLAKFHALSVAFSAENPEEFESVVTKLKCDGAFNGIKNYLETVVTKALRVVKKENRERFSKFTTELLKKEEFESYYVPRKLAVIAHKDYRPSNLMYKKVDGKMEVIPVDFQTLDMSNPIVDIMYFIFNGSDKKFREKYFNQCLDHYYSELCKAFKRLGLNPEEIYTREDYDSEVKKLLPVGLIASLFCLLVVTADSENTPKVGASLSIEDFAIDPNDRFIERINDIIDDLIKMEAL